MIVLISSVCVASLISGGIRIGGQEHFYMETQSVLVVPVGEEMEFDVYISTQWPALIQVQKRCFSYVYS